MRTPFNSNDFLANSTPQSPEQDKERPGLTELSEKQLMYLARALREALQETPTMTMNLPPASLIPAPSPLPFSVFSGFSSEFFSPLPEMPAKSPLCSVQASLSFLAGATTVQNAEESSKKRKREESQNPEQAPACDDLSLGVVIGVGLGFGLGFGFARGYEAGFREGFELRDRSSPVPLGDFGQNASLISPSSTVLSSAEVLAFGGLDDEEGDDSVYRITPVPR